jgi:chromosome segregation ATPase
MLTESPETLLYITLGAFVGGWLLAKISGFLGTRFSASARDPRDDRIRSLEADLRVAHTSNDKVKVQLDERARELAEVRKNVTARDKKVAELERSITGLREDLKDSVIKTRELRAELAERATENVRSELKLREVETELSVAQASTDLLATGMLDYTTSDDDEELPAFRAGG